MANNISLMSSQSSFVASTKFTSSKSKVAKFLMSNTLPSNIRNTNTNKVNRTNWKKTMTPEKIEIFLSLEGWVESNIMTHLKPVEQLWQPQDFLPNASQPDEEFFEDIKGIRERALEIPDEYYVCLVGDMITEEALPTYQSFVYSLFGSVCDTSGANTSSWAKWTRGWTAEENRHGDLLNKYLYFSGRCDMKQIEKTIQYLIRDGMDTGADGNPYLGLVYTSFQERATFISHGNTARHAKQYGDPTLAKICGLIASDEKRHEHAYTKIVEKLFEIDPNTTMLALAHMMKHRITMPAHFMFDGKDENLFNHYSIIAQRIGVYTSKDYADIVEFFVKRWNVEKVGGLSSEGRKAQEYVCGLVDRFRKLEERSMVKKAGVKGRNDGTIMPFSWIFNRVV